MTSSFQLLGWQLNPRSPLLAHVPWTPAWKQGLLSAPTYLHIVTVLTITHLPPAAGPTLVNLPVPEPPIKLGNWRHNEWTDMRTALGKCLEHSKHCAGVSVTCNALLTCDFPFRLKGGMVCPFLCLQSLSNAWYSVNINKLMEVNWIY